MERREVLVVDGDKGFAQLVRVHLGALGYEVVKAYDGVSALAAARHGKPDLAVLELALTVAIACYSEATPETPPGG
jgi:CheY-like chemotaxis protein